MARAKWAVYNADGVPVMLVTGDKATAEGNVPEGGTVQEVGQEVTFLEDVPALGETNA